MFPIIAIKDDEANSNLSWHQKFAALQASLSHFSWAGYNVTRCDQSFQNFKNPFGRKLEIIGHVVQARLSIALIFLTHAPLERFKVPQNLCQPLSRLHKGVEFLRKSFTQKWTFCSFGQGDKLLGLKLLSCLVKSLYKTWCFRKFLSIRTSFAKCWEMVSKLRVTYSRERGISIVQVFSSGSFISLVIMGEAKRPHHYIHHIRKYIFQNYVACTLHINPDECFDTLATS